MGADEFYRYLQLRDYFKKEIKVDSSKEVNGVIQIIIKAYQESNIRIISASYKGLNTNEKHSTKYIKMKWEKELNVQIPEKDWHDMWRTHHSFTNSRTWREFSWKNLICFSITPKVKSKQLHKHQKCWRECGSYDVDHSHVFWNCQKITVFWEMVYEVLKQILGYEVPKSILVLYVNFKKRILF